MKPNLGILTSSVVVILSFTSSALAASTPCQISGNESAKPARGAPTSPPTLVDIGEIEAGSGEELRDKIESEKSTVYLEVLRCLREKKRIPKWAQEIAVNHLIRSNSEQTQELVAQLRSTTSQKNKSRIEAELRNLRGEHRRRLAQLQSLGGTDRSSRVAEVQ